MIVLQEEGLRPGDEFEKEVRRVARHIYASADTVRREHLDGREHDAVIRSDEAIYIIEATTRADKQKIIDDSNKLKKQVIDFRKQNLFCKGIIVTKEDPTDHQVEVVKKKEISPYVEIYGFHEFKKRLFDGVEYLRCRENQPFGSLDGRSFDDENESNTEYNPRNFVPLGLIEASNDNRIYPETLLKKTSNGGLNCIIGEFGVGKSATLRYLFDMLSKSYLSGDSVRCPVFLNLREHAGQVRPGEALTRHCEDIGFKSPTSLVKAWRAGYVDLILDGFDELSNPTWGMSITKVREFRRTAVEIIREFVKHSNFQSRLYVAGRDNYFDTTSEMSKSLSIPYEKVYRVDSPNHKEVKKIAHKLGYKGDIPQWLPSRPLFISYFCRDDTNIISGEPLAPAIGWDKFIDKLCKREENQNRSLDQEAIRSILERLATRARASADGLSGITTDVFNEEFINVVGYQPDPQSLTSLLRICGLRSSASGDGSRQFIDAELAGALKAGDIVKYVAKPFDENSVFEIEDLGECPEITYIICGYLADKTGYKIGHWNTAIKQAENRKHSAFIHDAFCFFSNSSSESVADMHIEGRMIDNLDFADNDRDLSPITFSDCIIHRLKIGNVPEKLLPTFTDCIIGNIETLNDASTFKRIFLGTTDFAEISRMETHDEVMDSQLSRPRKVAISILRKLFKQSGTSRERSALYKGLGPHERILVDKVLDELVKEELCYPVTFSKYDLVTPERNSTHRVNLIISQPGLSEDIVMKKIDKI